MLIKPDPEHFSSILPQDGEALLFPDFLDAATSQDFYTRLYREVEWQHEAIFLYGKQIMQPRLTAWFSDPHLTYGYSGITLKASSWTKALLEIKAQVELVIQTSFNSALLNLYRDERDSVSWHSDNERELGRNPVIASLSFGSARVMQFRHRERHEMKVSAELPSGSLLLMQGETQHCWEHCIPKRAKPLDPRINITFRVIKPL